MENLKYIIDSNISKHFWAKKGYMGVGVVSECLCEKPIAIGICAVLCIIVE